MDSRHHGHEWPHWLLPKGVAQASFLSWLLRKHAATLVAMETRRRAGCHGYLRGGPDDVDVLRRDLVLDGEEVEDHLTLLDDLKTTRRGSVGP